MNALSHRFQLIHSLGEGAMGRVWLAHDRAAEREVAVKVLASSLEASAKSVLMFKQEFRWMSGLRHPHCCSVYDFGVTDEGHPFFTMEVVRGAGLDERLPLPPARVRELLRQLLLGLAYVHLQGYVHRDIKSANVRERPDGVVKLMDFGLMDLAGRGGVIAGTLPYVSPEMARRDAVDARSDLYAVGVLAYELLTGRLPFNGASPIETLRAHLNDPPPPLEGPAAADEVLVAVVMRLLAKVPLLRYQSAYEVLEALGYELPSGEDAQLLYAPISGHEPARRALAAVVERVKAGQGGGTTVVCGPSGIGKSRVLEEALHNAQLEGLSCASGACLARTRRPFGPFVQILRQLLPALRVHAPLVLERHAATLALLVPELSSHAAEAADDAWQGLQAALTEVFSALAGATGLLLVLEDWQWADPSSERLLGAMQRATAGEAVGLLIAARSAGSTGESLPLAPLALAEVEQLMASMLGDRQLAEALAEHVTRLSEGNPAFVERVLGHMVHHGLLVRSGTRWQLSARLDLEALPHHRAALVRSALEALPPDAVHVATVGALAGQDFDLELVSYASGLEHQELFAALEALRRARLLVTGAGGSYAFADESIPELLLERLDPLDAAFLHGVLARALEERLRGFAGATPPLELVLAVAEHHLLGPAKAQALPFALEAGLRCAGLQANQEAERFLGAALGLMDEAGNAGLWTQRQQALAKLGHALRGRGELARACAAYEEALLLAEALQSWDQAGLLRVDLGNAASMAGQAAEARGWLASALEGRAGERPAVVAYALTTRALHQLFAGDAAAGLASARQALAIATDHALPAHTLAEARVTTGFLLVTTSPAGRAEGMALLEAAIATFEQGDRKSHCLDSYAYLGTAQLQAGLLPAARRTFEHMRLTALQCGLATQEVIALINLALCDMGMGDFSGAERHAASAAQLAIASGYAFPAPMAIAARARSLAMLGQAGAALAELEAAAARPMPPYVQAQVHAMRVEVLLHLGQTEALEAACAELAGLVAEAGQADLSAGLQVALAESSLRRQRPDEARARLAAVPADASGPLLARKLRVEALLAIAQERWPDVQPLLGAALGHAEAASAHALVAELHGLLGELALAEGGRQAAEHFAAMAAAAERTQIPLHAALASFGQAAAAPYDAGATTLVAGARAALERAMTGLPPEDRLAFCGYPERRRVQDGNATAFSLPRTRRTTKLPPMPRDFGPL